MNDSTGKRFLLIILFALLASIVFGLFWFFALGPATPVGFGWYLFSFAAGLSMIVMPCTLPLAFVIVPLSMGKGPAKGLLIALAFGIGVAFTLSMYGVLAAVIGKVAIGSLGAPLELVKNWLYLVAGIFAYIFALGELGLLKFRMPSYTGAFPGFIQKQQDVLKALLLGLFLGNIGVGCPHPATPVILTRIAAEGDILYGWLLFLVHAIGRILPLLFLAILGILGVNALQSLVSKKEKIERVTGWGMVFVAAFILVLGLFTHDWWVISGIHSALEAVTQESLVTGLVNTKLGTDVAHLHGLPPATNTGLFGLPLGWGTWTLIALWILPLVWNYLRKRNEANAMPEGEEKHIAQSTRPFLLANVISISALLVLVFGYILPHRFEEKAMMSDDGHGGHPATEASMMDGHGGHGLTMVHEASDVTSGPFFNVSFSPEPILTGSPARIDLDLIEKPDNSPIPAKELEVIHDKQMHLIGVRKDLQGFFHIHPYPSSSDDSRFSVDHVFTLPGQYKIWPEITYDGVTHVIGQPLFEVGGEGESEKLEKNFTATKIVGNYQVSLHYSILGKGTNHVDIVVKDSEGRNVELDDFLGEKMHLAVISEDLKRFVHAHPDTSHENNVEMNGDGHSDHSHSLLAIPEARADAGHAHDGAELNEPHVAFSIDFPEKGSYKLFGQFRPAGANLAADESLTAQFWVDVSENAPGAVAQQTLASAGSDRWWLNLIVSLVLMALLSLAVKRYITVPLKIKSTKS
jgi:cytochrome c-type biogenesis protein